MTLLDELLTPGALTTVFQPILRIGADGTRTVHGYEALTRGPRDTHASRADVLFEYVRQKRSEAVVDRACALSALRSARALPGAPSLSLNVHAATLGQDDGFVAFLLDTAAGCGIGGGRLVIEVVEQSSRWNSAGFARALGALRAEGVRIALDDVGFGHSNLHMVLEVRPQFLKLDRYFVTGASADRARWAVLATMQRLATELDAQVVAEGVETTDDLAGVLAAGIHLAQGFLFSPPVSAQQLHDQTSPRPSAVSLSA